LGTVPESNAPAPESIHTTPGQHLDALLARRLRSQMERCHLVSVFEEDNDSPRPLDQ